MSEAAAKNTHCFHPFVWPNGDCVECGVLATTLPGHTEPTHISLPRKFTPLIDKYEARIEELGKALAASNSWICNTPAMTPAMGKIKFQVVSEAEKLLAGGKQ